MSFGAYLCCWSWLFCGTGERLLLHWGTISMDSIKAGACCLFLFFSFCLVMYTGSRIRAPHMQSWRKMPPAHGKHCIQTPSNSLIKILHEAGFVMEPKLCFDTSFVKRESHRATWWCPSSRSTRSTPGWAALWEKYRCRCRTPPGRWPSTAACWTSRRCQPPPSRNQAPGPTPWSRQKSTSEFRLTSLTSTHKILKGLYQTCFIFRILSE